MIVDQSEAGRRAGYISISNNDDATCVAWITVKQYDDTFGGAWTGDIGKACGQSWYASVEPAGRQKAEGDGDDEFTGDEYVPACTWLDGDHTNDIESAALKFDTAAYGDNVQDTIGNDACAFTLWGNDNGPIAGTFATTSTSLIRHACNFILTPPYRSAWSPQAQQQRPPYLDERATHHVQLYEPYRSRLVQLSHLVGP